MNPINLFQMMRGGPQQVLQQMMNNNPQMNNNPLVKNMLDMAQKGNIQGIENIGRNMAKEKGIDFDKAFSDFRNQFGIK